MAEVGTVCEEGERVVGLGLVFENDGRMVMVLFGICSHGGD